MNDHTFYHKNFSLPKPYLLREKRVKKRDKPPISNDTIELMWCFVTDSQRFCNEFGIRFNSLCTLLLVIKHWVKTNTGLTGTTLLTMSNEYNGFNYPDFKNRLDFLVKNNLIMVVSKDGNRNVYVPTDYAMDKINSIISKFI